jgi:hypothetical protein
MRIRAGRSPCRGPAILRAGRPSARNDCGLWPHGPGRVLSHVLARRERAVRPSGASGWGRTLTPSPTAATPRGAKRRSKARRELLPGPRFGFWGLNVPVTSQYPDRAREEGSPGLGLREFRARPAYLPLASVLSGARAEPPSPGRPPIGVGPACPCRSPGHPIPRGM